MILRTRTAKGFLHKTRVFMSRSVWTERIQLTWFAKKDTINGVDRDIVATVSIGHEFEGLFAANPTKAAAVLKKALREIHSAAVGQVVKDKEQYDVDLKNTLPELYKAVVGQVVKGKAQHADLKQPLHEDNSDEDFTHEQIETLKEIKKSNKPLKNITAVSQVRSHLGKSIHIVKTESGRTNLFIDHPTKVGERLISIILHEDVVDGLYNEHAKGMNILSDLIDRIKFQLRDLLGKVKEPVSADRAERLRDKLEHMRFSEEITVSEHKTLLEV